MDFSLEHFQYHLIPIAVTLRDHFVIKSAWLHFGRPKAASKTITLPLKPSALNLSILKDNVGKRVSPKQCRSLQTLPNRHRSALVCPGGKQNIVVHKSINESTEHLYQANAFKAVGLQDGALESVVE